MLLPYIKDALKPFYSSTDTLCCYNWTAKFLTTFTALLSVCYPLTYITITIPRYITITIPRYIPIIIPRFQLLLCRLSYPSPHVQASLHTLSLCSSTVTHKHKHALLAAHKSSVYTFSSVNCYSFIVRYPDSRWPNKAFRELNTLHIRSLPEYLRGRAVVQLVKALGYKP